ncbi:MAG TPA: hypothetical protein VII66_07770 [Gemmatimonadaceae bacterium]
MRYGSLVASAAVLLGLAACKGNDAGMNADLAKDLSAAKTSDALSLAPHAGLQTVVSAQELSPQGRARMQSSSKSSRVVRRRTPHRELLAAHSTEVAAVPAPAPAVTPDAPAAATVAAPVAQTPVAVLPRPQPVDIPASEPGPSRGDGGGGGIGGIIGAIGGAIGGAILRGGVVDGDHCDPRSHGGGGILINRRGPIFRGSGY